MSLNAEFSAQRQFRGASRKQRSGLDDRLADFARLSKRDPHSLTTAELDRQLLTIFDLSAYTRELMAVGIERARAGAVLPSFKWVNSKKGPRRWALSPEATIAEVKVRFGFDPTVKGCMTPTQCEHRIGKHKFKAAADIIDQEPPEPLLVPYYDKRRAVRLAR